MKKDKHRKIISCYLDVCCLNRPFDDQTQNRIRIEAESIIILLKMSLAGKIKIIGSDIVKHEISKTPDPVRKSQLLSLSNYISKNYSLSDGMIELAHELQKNGFGAFDALHIAVSEKCGVDVFITTDDKILKLYQRKSDLINIRIDNPVNILRELLL